MKCKFGLFFNYGDCLKSININYTDKEREISLRHLLNILTMYSYYKLKINNNEKGLVRTLGQCTLNIKLTFSDIVYIKPNGPIFEILLLNESWQQPRPLA